MPVAVSPMVMASRLRSSRILLRRLSVLPLPDPLPLKREKRASSLASSRDEEVNGDELEAMRQRLPRLLRRQLATELVMVLDVDVRLVALELLERIRRLSLLPDPVVVLPRRLVLVTSASLDALQLALGEAAAAVGEPEVLLALGALAIGGIGSRSGEVAAGFEEGEGAGETASDQSLGGGAELRVENECY